MSLRKHHRIVGAFIGALGRAPRQIQQSGLPLILSNEEIALLVAEELVTLVRFSDPQTLSEGYANKLQLHYQMSYQDQIEIFRAAREQEILNMSEKIVQGALKKRKREENVMMIAETEERKQKAHDQIIKGQIANIGQLPEAQSLVQTFTEQPWINFEANKVVIEDWQFIGLDVKRLTFHDLWNRGFYITDGTKFGGHFLAYPGDPMLFHAKYIVICFENPEEIFSMTERDLVAKSRLGTNVKKTVLLAYVTDDENINYKSLRWTDSKKSRE